MCHDGASKRMFKLDFFFPIQALQADCNVSVVSAYLRFIGHSFVGF
jgi:hypothetical protein